MMHMTFYWGTSATLLFDQWMTTTAVQYYLSLFGIFLFAILHEWLFNLRVILSTKKTTSQRHHDPDNGVPLLEKVHITRTKGVKDVLVALLYGINAGTSFLLMLLVMSFNGGVFLAVVAGMLAGFGLFREPFINESINSSDACCNSG